MTHQVQGVALGAEGGVVMVLAREGSGAQDIIVDDGRKQTISLMLSAIWQVAVDRENYIVARPDVVGVADPSDGTVRTIAQGFSHLYTANAHALGWQNSPPGQPKFVDWAAYNFAGRNTLARLDGADRVLSGSADYLLARTDTGLLRASRDGGVEPIPESGDVSLGCIWGGNVVLVSATDRRNLRVWSAEQEAKYLSVAAPVDELLCGCGSSPYFVAISQEGQGLSTGVRLDGSQLALPMPLIRVDNPGPFWTSDCIPTQ